MRRAGLLLRIAIGLAVAAGSVSCGSAPAATPTSSGPTATPAVLSSALQQQLLRGLGNGSWSPDTSRSNNSVIHANLGGQVSVTDVNGYKWTVSIPPYALPSDLTITATATNDVGGAPGFLLNSAIILSPDRLGFGKPVHVTVSYPAGRLSGPTIYTALKDGSDMQFATPTPDGGADIGILGGLALGGGPPEPIVQTDFDTLNTITELLTQSANPTTYPTPLTLSGCGGNTDSELTGYGQQFGSPEIEAARALYATSTHAALQYPKDAARFGNLTSTIATLLNRVVARDQIAYTAVQNEPTHVQAIAWTVLYTQEILQETRTPVPTAFSAMFDWASHIWTTRCG